MAGLQWWIQEEVMRWQLVYERGEQMKKEKREKRTSYFSDESDEDE
jgi:hypothetical protein